METEKGRMRLCPIGWASMLDIGHFYLVLLPGKREGLYSARG